MARLIRLVVLLLLAAAPAAMARTYWQSDAALGAVQYSAPFSLTVPEDGRQVPVKVIFPGAPGPHPVIVFSHGAYSSKDEYDRLAIAWAGAGYVVILPTHVDSTAMGAVRGQPPRADSFITRVRDIDLIVDQLAEIETRVTGLAGMIDPDRLAIAGHSYGGQLAQVLTGAPIARAPDGGPPQSYLDQRFKVALVLMGAGPIPNMMSADAWQAIGGTPQLVIAGTADQAIMVQGGDWRWRYEPFTLLPAGDKYGVVLDGSDHYLGGLICRPDVPGPLDGAGLQVVNAVAVAFLDAYLRDDAEARTWLTTVDLTALTGGKGSIERK